jgi:hypothetical protein
MGDQTAQQFSAYYNPALISPTELQAGGFLDAYSEFASGKKACKVGLHDGKSGPLDG